MRCKALLFDLDGTLADTLEDIAAVTNRVLAELGCPTIETPRYRQLVGRGVHRLFTRAMGPGHEDLIPRAAELFELHYATDGQKHTVPYEGVPEMLDALVERGLRMAVLSNKPDDGAQDTVREVLGRWRFDLVRGHRPPTPLKPDPAAALEISDVLGIAPEHWLYLGDTAVDMQTAVGAGMFPVGVLWGFRDEAELRENGAEVIIGHPLEVLPLLDRQSSD